VARAEISVQKMPSRAQHARHFGEEAWKPRVVVRSFDIDHRVEGLSGKRQILGVAATDLQHPFAAEIDLSRRAVITLDENRSGSSETASARAIGGSSS
jgi:hypothetical protein